MDCSYGLNAGTPKNIDIYRSYKGKIGLPEIRDDGSMETLPCWLRFNTSGSAFKVRVGLGQSGDGPSIIRIDGGASQFDCTVNYTQTGLLQKVFSIKGTHVSNKLLIMSGDTSLGIRPEDVGIVDLLQLTPSDSTGDDMSFSSSSSSTVARAYILGGVSSFGVPPSSITALGGTIICNGTGRTNFLDITSTVLKWIANGTLGTDGVVEGVAFGSGFGSSSSSPAKVRITDTAHGLTSGQRVYIRSNGGVVGLDGNVYAVQVVDSDTFDLLGSLAYGTYTGYSETMRWALASQLIVRADAVLDFDSDGSARDIVSPIIIQNTGKVSDSKATVVDLRLWPEQVPEFLYLGQSIEIRRKSK